MTKRDAGEEFLACLFGDNDSDKNSNFEIDSIIRGGFSEGDSAFGDLLIASRDHQDMYRHSIPRVSNEPDQEANGTVGNTGVPGAVITRSKAENHALAALQITMLQGAPTNPAAT